MSGPRPQDGGADGRVRVAVTGIGVVCPLGIGHEICQSVPPG